MLLSGLVLSILFVVGVFVEIYEVVVLEGLAFECTPFLTVDAGGEIGGVFVGGLDGGVVENGGVDGRSNVGGDCGDSLLDWGPVMVFFEFMSNLKEPVNCGNNKLEFENWVSVGDVVFIDGGHIELDGIVMEGVFEDN